MKFPEGKIWLVFAVCVLLVVSLMAYLAMLTIRMERDRDDAHEQLARGQVALAIEEKVNNALWRIDSALAMLVSQESARNPAEYSPFLPADGEMSGIHSPSPILEQPNDLVRLHFEVGSDGTVTSPQSVQSSGLCEQAIACGVSSSNIERSTMELERVRKLITYPRAILSCEAVEPLEQQMERPWIQQQNRPLPLGNRKIAGASPPWIDSPDQAANNSYPTAAAKLQTSGNLSDYVSRRAIGENDRRAKYSRNNVYNATIDNSPSLAGESGQIRAGVMSPVWIDDELFLLRQVVRGEGKGVQGCWLNWDQLNRFLANEIADLFPNAEFLPVRDSGPGNPGRTSTTLPIELVVNEAVGANDLVVDVATRPGGLGPALFMAIGAILLSVAALGLLMAGVIRLSERRATFVSAVSHELRTPLTTVRLYSEMLADGIVSDELQRNSYLQTLKSESGRLGHLVDNVLDYAGIESGSNRTFRRELVVGEVADRIVPVLQRMVNERHGQWTAEIESSMRHLRFHSDPQAIERVLINLVDNALKYGRSADGTAVIRFTLWQAAGSLVFQIADQGPGVSVEKRRQMFRPFSRSDRESAGGSPGVGLGLSLCQRIASELGGRIKHVAADPGSIFQLWLRA